MNDSMPMTTEEHAAGRVSARSSLLNDFRLNPFRVLRLSSEATPDDAVWRAEEILALRRAGVPPSEPDPLPWLPPANDAEIRQAVQAAEEPMRRLIARLSWFDFENDPSGELLRQAVSTLAPADVAAYRASPWPTDPPPPAPPPVVATPTFIKMSPPIAGPALPPPVEPKPDDGLGFWDSLKKLTDKISEPNSEASEPAKEQSKPKAVDQHTDTESAAFAMFMEGEPAKPAPPSPPLAPVSDEWVAPAPVVPPPPPPIPSSKSFRTMIRALNEANLQLLLAARVFHGERKKSRATNGKRGSSLNWTKTENTPVVVNPHDSLVTDTRTVESQLVSDVWWGTMEQPGALRRWVDVLQKPAFKDFLKSCLIELGDEIIGPDDAESVSSALWTRLTDALAGEAKVQLEEGRHDRAAALLRVAGSSGVETRRWVLTLRSIRPRFKAEVAELDAILGTGPHGLGDIELFLDRTSALARRWEVFDPSDLLGLREVVDNAVMKALGLLNDHRNYSTIERVAGLMRRAGDIASADSLKQRAISAATRLEDYRQYGCHFCGKRDMDIECSVILRGQKVTHVEHRGNTTITHYRIRHEWVPRCARCGELHQYMYHVGIFGWVGLALPAAFLGFVAVSLFYDKIQPLLGLILLALYIGLYAGCGYFIRWWLAARLTPKPERHYWDVYSSKQYKSLQSENYSIGVDYSKGAYARARAENRSLSRG